MSANQNLSPDQFFGGRFGGTTKWEDLHPTELEPHVIQHPNLRNHPDTVARVDEIAASIREKGFLHDPDLPIHLIHEADGSKTLMNGNHRAQALVKAGHNEKVKVAVTRR